MRLALLCGPDWTVIEVRNEKQNNVYMYHTPEEGRKVSEARASRKTTSAARLRVVCVGLGAIGQAVARACNEEADIELVGLIDPARAGEKFYGLRVAASREEWTCVQADLAVLSTGSSFERIASECKFWVRLGLDVVSTCEELAFPWLQHSDLAGSLDSLSRREGRRVLGCGVNPGFIMDVVPVFVASASLCPTSVVVRRRVDLSRRRVQLREKLGVGLAEREWLSRGGIEIFGHVGLVESAYLCALGIGWPVEKATFHREPISRDGVVRGVREQVDVRAEGGQRIELELTFELESAEDEDLIEVNGSPPLRLTFERGVQGEEATVARVLNSARVLPQLPAGLRLPLEVPGWSGNAPFAGLDRERCGSRRSLIPSRPLIP
jgi:hypothetical protein